MNNQRNDYGVKDAVDTYRTIKGKKYIQYTDFANPFDAAGNYVQNLMGDATDLQTAKRFIKEVAQIENPETSFVAIKQKEGYYRIYQQIL